MFGIDNMLNMPEQLSVQVGETSTQVFFCEICVIFKNTLFTEHLSWLHLKWFLSAFTKYQQHWILKIIRFCASKLSYLCRKIYSLFWKRAIKSVKLPKSSSHFTKKLFYLLQWKPFKNDKKCFLFHLKSPFHSQDI